MAVHYNGKMPERNFTIRDFCKNGITLTSFHMYRNSTSKKRNIRCTFQSNGLIGTIRTTCYENSFAIDVVWGRDFSLYPNERCLTTECKTLREAKSILFVWFRSHGFYISDKSQITPRVEFKNFQGTLSPFLF